MKALYLSYKLPLFGSALALTMLIGTMTASALQVANPSTAATAPPKAGPGLNTLTPTAPMSSYVPASDQDIRDIRQPRHIPTLNAWTVAAVGVVLLSAAGLVAWRWTRRGK